MSENKLLLIINDTTNPYKKQMCESFLSQLQNGRQLSYRQKEVANAWYKHYQNKVKKVK